MISRWPPRGFTKLTEKAEISRDCVIDTLRRNGVTVTATPANGVYLIEKGDMLESHTLPPQIGRRGLQYFQRHFGVSIHLFFNAPEPPALTVVKPTKTA
jgi:hypothetical protein